MASKNEMIEFIIGNSDQDKNDLESLNYKKVKTIFNNINKEEEVIINVDERKIIIAPENIPVEETKGIDVDGSIDYKFNIMGNDEDFFLTTRSDEQTKIDTLPSAEEIEVELEEEPKVEAKKDGTAPDFNESGEIQKKIISDGIDIKSLSPVQKRAYARSGRIPKKK